MFEWGVGVGVGVGVRVRVGVGVRVCAATQLWLAGSLGGAFLQLSLLSSDLLRRRSRNFEVTTTRRSQSVSQFIVFGVIVLLRGRNCCARAKRSTTPFPCAECVICSFLCRRGALTNRCTHRPQSVVVGVNDIVSIPHFSA
jgi:hypothetical protein